MKILPFVLFCREGVVGGCADCGSGVREARGSAEVRREHGMRVRARVVAGASMVMGVATVASVASGQTVLPVTSSWQISLDNGTTWQGGTVLTPQSQASVKVRNFVTWGDGVTRHPFSSAQFDGVVRSLEGAGLGDSVTNIVGVFGGVFQPPVLNIQGRRWAPDLIKIDSIGDTQAPGLFPFVTLGPGPAGGPLGPLSIFEYDLMLDGTAGSRLITAAWRINSQNQPTLVVGLSGNPGPYTWQVTLQDATLVVVPSPAGLAVLGVASDVLLRRRRGM